MAEIFISVDVECSGYSPGQHAMYSIGAVAYDSDGKCRGSFSVNLEMLPGAVELPEVSEFWDSFPEAAKAHREHPVAIADGMRNFASWLNMLKEKKSDRLIFVAYPLGYDWQFVNWYFAYANVANPFGGMFDVRSFAMGKLGTNYRGGGKANLPAKYTDNLPPHTHIAIDDARSQGELFLRLYFDKFTNYA